MRNSFRPYTAAEEGHYAIGGVPLTAAEIERGVPTVTTTPAELAEAAREGSAPALPEAAESTAESRACARDSVTRADSIAFQAVTHSARAVFRGGVSALAALDRAGSLPDAQPPTLRQAREWQHRCAGHYQSLLMRWPRLLWGYVHLLIVKPALNGLEWVTASPARAAVAAALLAVIWI